MLLGLHVRIELVLPIETLVARAAHERPDPAVHHLVPGKIGGVREFLVACLASVGFLPRVLPQVFVQVTPMLERLITVSAVHQIPPGLLLLVLLAGGGLRFAPGGLLVPRGLPRLDHVHQKWQSSLLLPTIRAAAIVGVLLLFVPLLPIVAAFFHFLAALIGCCKTRVRVKARRRFFFPNFRKHLPGGGVFEKHEQREVRTRRRRGGFLASRKTVMAR